jgi:hypothetical protein
MDYYRLQKHSWTSDLSMIGASRLNDVDIGKNDGPQWEIAETFREWNGILFR